MEKATNQSHEPGALEMVREARHRISEQYGHDIHKMVSDYIEQQKAYKDRIVGYSS